MKLASAAIMIHPRYLLDSIIAWKVSASEFSHRLDPERKLMALNVDLDTAEPRRVWCVHEICISSSDEGRQPHKVVECADLAVAACPPGRKGAHDRTA